MYEIHGSRKPGGESRKEMVQVAVRREETATLEWNQKRAMEIS